MKTIKIYSFPSHQTKERTSGVDFARILQPMKYLNGYTSGDVTFHVDFFDINKEPPDNWLDLAKDYDLIYLNYTVLDWSYAHMGAAVHGQGKKIIMDIDDAIWYVQKDNITHDKLRELNAGYLVGCMLSDVDGVTTTNGYLRNVIADKTSKYHDKIKVIPNQVDLSLYNHVSPVKDTSEITLLHYGSTSHFDDLLDPSFVSGVDRIFQEYPNVKIKMVGAFISELKHKWGNRYENDFGDVDIYRWIKKYPQFMDEADIVVVPLRDTMYNRCKSDIKFIETASAGKPGVFSRTRPYMETIDDGTTGFLASTPDEWYGHIKQLIDSRVLRETIGTNALKYVTEHRQIQQNIQPYADFFEAIATG